MSTLGRLKRSLRFYRKRGKGQRGRIITHAKAGRRAPRLRRAYDRTKGMIAGRRRSIRRHSASDRPSRAIRVAATFLGKSETHGPNRAPWLDPIERHYGFLGAPYCGMGCGWCLEEAGVQGITSRVAAVAFIYEDAGAGRNGFAKRVSHTGGQPGDLVGLFSTSTHVEMIVKRHSWGYETIGFNTSPEGSSGSQANGGGVYRRKRPFSAVAYVARPAY